MKRRTQPDRLAVAFVALAGLALMGLAALYWSSRRASVPGTEASEGLALTAGESARAEPESAFRRLQGRWLRPDGGYVLELGWVGGEGRVEAKYFNPNPIFVSRAECSQDGDRIKLMVELQDTGYPGCVYTLHYDPDGDRLVGNYYQAALREDFEVEFDRMR